MPSVKTKVLNTRLPNIYHEVANELAQLENKSLSKWLAPIVKRAIVVRAKNKLGKDINDD